MFPQQTISEKKQANRCLDNESLKDIFSQTKEDKLDRTSTIDKALNFVEDINECVGILRASWRDEKTG